MDLFKLRGLVYVFAKLLINLVVFFLNIGREVDNKVHDIMTRVKLKSCLFLCTILKITFYIMNGWF